MMNQAPAPTTRPTPLALFKSDLDDLHKAGELALPSTVDFGAFRNALTVAITDNPAILSCRKETIFRAVRTLAAAGLVPDGREAAIVPFKGEAQAMPMVYGLVKVARNSGKITTLWADVVYDGETLEVWVEDGERKWDHRMADGSRVNAMARGGDIIGAYAVAKLDDGTVEFQPMGRDEIEKRRQASANQRGPGPSGIWEKWYGEMAKKTVIRNLCKRLPMSSEDMDRIMREQDEKPLRDVTPPADSGPNLAQRLAGAQERPQEAHVDVLAADAGAHHDDAPTGASTLSDGASFSIADLNLDDAFPGAAEFTEGVKAFEAGQHIADCPHMDDKERATDWCGGWTMASKAKG